MRKEHIQFTFGIQNESVTAFGSCSNHIHILIVEDKLIARVSLKNRNYSYPTRQTQDKSGSSRRKGIEEVRINQYTVDFDRHRSAWQGRLRNHLNYSSVGKSA